jgi:putative effector of murein hydrolase
MPTIANPLLVALLMLATIAAYILARRLYLRSGQHPLFQPVFFGALLLIPCLLLLGRSVDDYLPAKTLLTWPLGPATAALALPVYTQRGRLRAALLPLLVGVLAGSLATMASVLGIAALAGLSTPVLKSLAAKSVTAAIAVELSRLQGGDPSLTAPAVVLTGMLGAMLGPAALSWARVRQPLARGIALGTISHAQGTAVALQEHEASGAVSTLALFGAALVTTLLLPLALPEALHLLGR